MDGRRVGFIIACWKAKNKAIALSVYLAVIDESHTRDAPAPLLWPESDQTRARTALRRTLWALKKAIGEDGLEIRREAVGLKRGPGFWLDVAQFHGQLAECRRHGHRKAEACPACLSPLSKAVELHRDDFLAGFTLRDSPSFKVLLATSSKSRLSPGWPSPPLPGRSRECRRRS